MSIPTIFFVLQIGYICIMKRIVVIVIIICSALGVFSQNKAYSFSMREKWTPTWVDKSEDNGLIVDAAQYIPIALPWTMKAIGQPTRSGWGRMSISQGLGTVMMGGSVKMLKNIVGDVRPDATDDTSFPSGHTAWAFLGATMVERELGWRSPWYTFGAYTFASAVAMQRVVDKRHFPIDVAGGAVIGVVAGHLGYFIGDKIFGDKQLDNRGVGLNDDDENQPFISLETGMSFNLSNLSVSEYKLSREPSLNMGLKLGLPLGDSWGISSGVILRSTPVFFESMECERTYVAPENSVGVELSPYYRKQLSARISFNGEVACGYYRNFSLKSIDRAIETADDFVNARIAMGSTYRLNDNISLGATLGYEISNVEYKLVPNEIYGIKHHVKIDETIQALIVNISTKVLF